MSQSKSNVSASLAIQVLPRTAEAKTADVIRIVDAVIAYIAGTGMNYVVGPFETTVEGDWDELMAIIRRSNEICVEQGAESVLSYVKICYAPGREILSIEEKIGKYQG